MPLLAFSQKVKSDVARMKRSGIRERGMFGSPDCIRATKSARGMSIPPFRRGLKPPSTVEPSRREVQDVAGRRVMVAQSFKAGVHGTATVPGVETSGYRHRIVKRCR